MKLDALREVMEELCEKTESMMSIADHTIRFQLRGIRHAIRFPSNVAHQEVVIDTIIAEFGPQVPKRKRIGKLVN